MAVGMRGVWKQGWMISGLKFPKSVQKDIVNFLKGYYELSGERFSFWIPCFHYVSQVSLLGHPIIILFHLQNVPLGYFSIPFIKSLTPSLSQGFSLFSYLANGIFPLTSVKPFCCRFFSLCFSPVQSLLLPR